MTQNNFIKSREYFPMSTLSPGGVDVDFLTLLTSLCDTKNISVLHAIEGYLVNGQSREDALKEHGVLERDFSITLRELQRISNIIEMILLIKKERDN